MAGLLPMVGRDGELAALLAAYAAASAGRPQLVLVTGSAGIGKTRLVTELCARAGPPGGGARVRTGESAPLAGAALAYGPFVAALGDEAGWLLDGDSATDMLTARHRLFTRMLGALAGLADGAPLLLVLEDLHWADESTRELLAFLAVRLRDCPVLIVATLREDDLAAGARRWLAELERLPNVTRQRLAGLPDADIARLMSGFFPNGAPAGRLAPLIAAADGNPLFARELASHRQPGAPASITEAVLGKATAAGAAARAVIDQVSVADGGTPHDLLAAALPLSEPDLLTAVREAVGTGLLTAAGDGYAFSHALVRQVVYDELLPGERRLLHRRLATALAASPGPDAGRLAQHWHLAGCPDLAAAAAVIAARQAVSARAYPEAVRYYALVIELARWLPEAGPDLLEEAAQAASWARDAARAASWAADALAQSGAAEPAARAGLAERLARYRWEAGDPQSAVDVTEQALDLLAAGPASTLRARVLAALATRRMLLGELDRALPLAERAVDEARQVGAVAEQAHGLATLGVVRAQRGDPDSGLAALRTSFALARDAGSVEDLMRAAASHMYLLCTAGRFPEALEVAREGRRAARSLGAPPALTSILDHNTAAVLTATGEWAQADRLLAGLVAESAPSVTMLLRLLQLEIAVGRGDGERAADLAAALAKAPEDPRLTAPLHACLAEQALGAGDLALAADEVAEGLAALAGADLPAEEIRLLAAGARTAADLAALPAVARPAAGGRWDPAALPGRARTLAGRHDDQPHVAAFAALVAAEDARRRGADDRDTWRAVARAWQAAGYPYREAYARLREAQAAARAGRREQAARALAACETLARQLPSRPLLALAADLAARARLIRQPRQPGAAAGPPAAARFDLTPREGDVLALLAAGDSNRQIARALFISERTVAVHVSRILDKLGVRNRTEAATAGARLGLVPPSPRGDAPSARPDEVTDVQDSPDRR